MDKVFLILLALCFISKGSIASSMKKKCLVHNIKLQENFDIEKMSKQESAKQMSKQESAKQLSGTWYDIARLPQSHDNVSLSSGSMKFQVNVDSSIQIQYTGEIRGKCADPLSASGLQVKGSRMYIRFDQTSHGFLKGPFWVVETDYNNYALIYGCNKVKSDGYCYRHHELVYIVGRSTKLPRKFERRINHIIGNKLCVNPHRLEYATHKYTCPFTEMQDDLRWNMLADAPVVQNITEIEDIKENDCKFSDILVYEDFNSEKIKGLWYILGTQRPDSDSNITSASFYLTQEPGGGFSTLYMAAMNGVCMGRSFPGTLKEYIVGNSTWYYADYGSIKGSLKFIYFTKDYEYGLTFMCEGERLDGTCEKSYTEIIGHSREFPENIKVQLKDQVNSVCLQQGEFHDIDQSLNCPIDTGEEKCVPSKKHFVKSVNWKALQGYWYTTAAYRGHDKPSMTWYIDLWAYTAFRMHRQHARNGECTKRETTTVNFDRTGRIYYNDATGKHMMQALFVDGNTVAILYECEKKDGNALCDVGDMRLYFLTRSRNIAMHQIESFKSLIESLCIDLEEIKYVSHAVNCDPTPRQEMYYERCIVSEIPVVESFEAERFSGHWHSLAVSKEGSQLDNIEINIESTKLNSGLSVWYSGAKQGQCVSTSRFELRPKNQTDLRADFTAVYGRFQGDMKVVYTDYDNYALVYECGLVEEDGRCADGHELVEIFGRKHVRPTQEVLNIGKDILKKTCFELQDVRITESVKSCPPIKGIQSCKIQDMPTQTGFSVKQVGVHLNNRQFWTWTQLQRHMLLGTWYRISTSKDRNHIESVQIHVSLNSEREVSIAMSFAINGSCQPGTTMLAILTKSNPAVWRMKYGKYIGTSLVAYMDTDFAVIYHCTRVLSDGSCAPLRHAVSVLARSNLLKTLNHEKKDEIISSIMPKLCTDPHDIEDVIHTMGCIPMMDHGSCKFDTLPLLKEFDIRKFLGVWYPIVKLKGSQTLDGSIVKFKQDSDGLVHVFFTGVGAVKDRCLPTMKGVLSKPAEKGAELFISYGETRGRMRIVFTNYDIALVYTCDHETDSGNCYAGQTSVDILSRSRNPNPDLKFPLLRRSKDLCIDPKDMVEVDHSIECEVEPEQGCTVDEVPVSDEIISSRIMGIWYSAARIRGSSTWESGVLELSLKRHPNMHVLAKFAGSRRGHCLPTREVSLYQGNHTGILHVEKPGSSKIIKLVTYRENYQYALFYQCNNKLPSGRCAPEDTYIDIMSRTRRPLPQQVLNQFAEVTYKYLCHQRSEFVLTSHKVLCGVSQSKICKVDYIPTQKYVEPEILHGKWYAYSQLQSSIFAPSARKFSVETSPHSNEKFIIRYAELAFGLCRPTQQVEVIQDVNKPGRATLVQDSHQADFLILYADKTHMLYYECFRRRKDGSCFPENVGIELLVREGKQADPLVLENVRKLVSETCYDMTDFEEVKFDIGVPCEVQPETPKNCDMSNLPIQKEVDLGKLLGKWYNAARLPGDGEWSSGTIEIEVVEGTDMVRIHSVVAVRGLCFPTLTVQWIPAGKGHSEWQTVIGSRRGYAAIMYLDDNTLVVYECDNKMSPTKCVEINEHVDIYSRTQNPLEHTTVAKLKKITGLMCLRMEYFEDVSHDVNCQLDHEPFIDCVPDNLPIAKNFNLELATGTWFAVMRLRGSGFVNAHQIRITKSENSGYDMHIVGARKASCLPELHGHLQPRLNDAADAIFTSDTNSVSVRTLFYDDNYHFGLLYECSLFQSDGKCAPGAVGLTLYSRSTQVPEDQFGEIWPILKGGCLNLGKDNFEVVPHGVSCELHGEDDDEFCDYNKIQPQPEFDAMQFTGTWYHLYRLRNSPQKYDSEVNYVDLMPNGNLRSYSTYFRDGRCSSTKISVYIPTRQKGEWWYGSHGGIKFVYTDYKIAVIYVCMQSHYDDSCYARDSEIEVLSRSAEPLSTDLMTKLKKALRSICLEIGDFDRTNHEVTCDVRKINCNIPELPQHPDFNMEMFTGTWYPIARLRNTMDSDGDVFRIAKSENVVGEGVYTMVQRMVFNGMCTDPYSSEWTRNGAATFVNKEKRSTGIFKVLYTDYTSAVLYLCNELYNATTCLPGEETVYVLSHDKTIEDRKLSMIIDKVPETCFSRRSFEWMPRSEHCPINPKNCAVNDLPSETNFNITKFAGVWYGMHQVRGHGNWQNGAVRYEVTGGKDLKITTVGTREGMCLDPGTLVSIQGDNVWEWTVVVGFSTSYVRILDASDLGDEHAIIYDCMKLMPDGICDPEFTFVDVISRKRTPFPEANRKHLRNIIREACLEPGDFDDAQHNVECELTRIPEIPCNTDNLPPAENFSLKLFSGDWYVIAKLNTSSMPDSTKLRIQYHANNTVTMYFTGYRARRGCTPTYSISFNSTSENPEYWQGDNVAQKILWTNYDVAMVYSCLNIQENRSCVEGFEHVLILSRTPYKLKEKNILSIGALGKDSCLNRHNFRWINQEVLCPLDLPSAEECSIEKLPITPSFSDELYLGHWYMRYTLRRDMWQNARMSFSKTKAGNYKVVFVLTFMGQCTQGYVYGYNTDTPGSLISRMSESLGILRTLYLDENYLLSYKCALQNDAGYCLESEEGIALFTRNLDVLPDDIGVWIAEKAKRECYEPGDFVPIHHSVNCDNTDWSTPISCVMPDLPIQEHFDFDKMTGTWYAVATHHSNPVFPSSAIRIEKRSEKIYQIFYTSFGAKGMCRPVDTTTVEVNPQRYPGEYELMFESMRGRMKIVYTDYQYALIYKCMRVTVMGYCEKGEDFFIVYSRNADLPDDAIQRMLSMSELSCTSHEEFNLIPHPVPCVLQSSKLKTVQCKMRNIPAQDNFDMKKFAGTWYSHYKLASKWKTVVQRYERDSDGNITIYYTGENKGSCFPERSVQINLDTGGRAIFFTDTSSQKVVYTDYHYAVITSCEDILADGTCSDTRRFMMIMSRCLKPIPGLKLQRLVEAVREACYEPGDLVFTPHHVNCDTRRRLPCNLSADLPIENDINMNKFTGKWYEVARLKGSVKSKSRVIHVEEYEEAMYRLSMTEAKNIICQPSVKLNLNPVYPNQPNRGQYILQDEMGSAVGMLRIIYTDYNNAVVYICNGNDELDNCPIGNLKLMVLSRKMSLSYTEMRHIMDMSGENCFQDDQFEWTDDRVSCKIDQPASCRYNNIVLPENFNVTLTVGQWFTRYHFRGVPALDSESFNIELLEDGNVRMHHTGAIMSDCIDHTNTYIHQKTDHAAVYSVAREGGNLKALNKFLHADEDTLIMLFCGKINDDGTCVETYERLQVLTHSRTAPIPEDKLTHLIGVVKSACFQPGQLEESTQQIKCNRTVDSNLKCDMEYLAAVKNYHDFDIDMYCGTWYPVAKLKGSFMSDNRAFRTEAKSGYYETYTVEDLGGECLAVGGWKVNVSDTGYIETYNSDWSELTGLSKVLYWSDDRDYVFMYHCAKPNIDDHKCIDGYEVTAVMFRIPKMPSYEILNDIVTSMSGCFDLEDLEPVEQNVACPFKEEIPRTCQVTHIRPQVGLSYGDLLGKWYVHYTLRQGRQAVEFGMAVFTVIDKTHFKGEFSFKVNGECNSVDTVYQASDHNPGEIFINIGAFRVSIKVLYQDDNYLVFYECETIQRDGSCKPEGHFMIIFGRTPSAPSSDDMTVLRKVVRGVCMEMGDLVQIPTQGECEIKIDRRNIGCSLTKLPVQKNFLVHKDTGHWYAIARLKGSNFPEGLTEMGLIDYENKKYTFYTSGKRGRGGCTATVKKDIPFQVPGRTAAKITINSNNHTGVWQMLYNDYRYALVFRCSHLLSENLCAPGQSYVVAYSRKPERIPMYVIERMLWAVSPACFTWDDFEWLPLEDQCKLDFDRGDCRVRNVPVMENFDLDRFVGNWYSRYLLVRNTDYDSFAARYEMTENNTLMLYHNGVSGGSCRRVQKQEYTIPNKNRGIFRWQENREKVSKVMWTDYKYAVIYTCDEVLEDDNCPVEKVYIDIIGKDLNAISPYIIEKMKLLLNSVCSTPGDFVESDHTLQCDENSCTISNVVTQNDFNAQSVFGTWQLIARTTHIDIERGPTTMEFMMGKDGNAKFAMARNQADGCKNYEVYMPVENDGTFYYSDNGLPGLFKIIYNDAEYLLLYDCFGTEPEEDYCPESNQEIQLWGRKHFLQESILDRATKIAREKTCVSLNNFMRIPENIACSVQKSCKFEDLVEQEHFDPRAILGSWQLIAKSMYIDPIFETGTMKLAYSGEEDSIYNYAGELLGSAECARHTGRIIRVSGKKAVYYFTYKSLESTGKYLYVDDEHHVLFECWGDLIDGVCPTNKTSIFIFGKTYTLSNEKKELISKQISRRTFGCYDTKKIHMVRENTCDVSQPYGRMSCKVREVLNDRHFAVDKMEGLWFLVARSDLVDFHWDAGVIFFSTNEEGIFNMKYTGLKEYSSNSCLKIFNIDINLDKDDKGRTTGLSYMQGGVKTTAKILYVAEDMFIWYECHGNKVTSNGDCIHGFEHIDVHSKRRRINMAQMNKILGIVREKTCINTDGFVYANHTKKCHLPNITDIKPTVPRPSSCKVFDVPSQKNFDIRRFAGLWYEVERTRYTNQNTWESSVIVFQIVDRETMTLRHAGTDNGDCKGPIEATVKLDARDNIANMKLFVGSPEIAGSPWTVHFVYKVVYTDYNTAITYACKFWRYDGSCDPNGLQVDILSRNRELSDEERSKLYDIISRTICIEIYDLVKPVYVEECHHLVGAVSPIIQVPPRYRCPAIMCAHFCPAYKYNDHGCQTCECEEEPDAPSGEVPVESPVNVTIPSPATTACVPLNCSVECVYGYQHVNGCQTCECQDAPVDHIIDLNCSPIVCSLQCPDGYVTDDKGCTLCKCKEKEKIPCPIPMCAQYCPGGYKHNEKGCMTCLCIDAPVDNIIDLNCSPIVCSLHCPDGYVRDDKGCTLCKCKEKEEIPCPIPMCALYCPGGYKHNEKGCMTCLCIENDEVTEESTQATLALPEGTRLRSRPKNVNRNGLSG